MFNMTVNDVVTVYEKLRNKYDLILTTTSALNEGFTVDCPIIVGKAHEQIIKLYEYGGEFVMCEKNISLTKETHWHPNNIEDAICDIVEFMDGKSDYVFPFNNH